MKYFAMLIVMSCMMMGSCKTNEVASPSEFEGARLILSHGGGFAGTYKTYCLLENGQLFKGSEQNIANQVTHALDKKVATQIFSNYEVLGLGQQKIESYDNLNYSIKMINKQGEEHYMIWGKGQKGAETAQLFYNNIMNQIRMNNSDKSIDESQK